MLGRRAYPRIHDRPSIHSFIADRIGPDGALPDPLCTLPNEPASTPGDVEPITDTSAIVLGDQMARADEEAAAARQLARAIIVAGAEPRERQLTELYAIATDEDTPSVIDATIEVLAAAHPPTGDLVRIGTWLATESPDRVPVKVGIAVLGLTGAPDAGVLHRLGAHEEFTLDAAVAFVRAREDPGPDLFALAQRVHGWGRIHCVQRLRGTADPAIARWILTDGFRNSVANEHLAHIAATTGDLAGALAEPDPDADVLAAASDIIDALLAGGPVADIDDYDLGREALTSWLEHMDRRAETLGELITVCAVVDFCDRDDWDERYSGSTWTIKEREAIRSTAAEIAARDHWPDLVSRADFEQVRERTAELLRRREARGGQP